MTELVYRYYSLLNQGGGCSMILFKASARSVIGLRSARSTLPLGVGYDGPGAVLTFLRRRALGWAADQKRTGQQRRLAMGDAT